MTTFNLVHKGRNPSRYHLSLLLTATAVLTIGADRAAAQSTDAPVLLSQVSVSANRTETPLAEVGSAVTVITGEELEQRQTRLVSDVLREVPGLAVNRTGGVGSLTQVRIRGSEGNQTMVLIDGIEVNDTAGGSEFDFAHLLAADVERIEVLRGPQSALYGSDAAGGLINIVTKRGAGKPVFNASLEGGSFNTYQGNASVRGGGERYHFLLSGVDYRTSGETKSLKSRGNNEADGYENQTMFTKFGFDALDNLNFNFVGRYTGFDMESDGSVNSVPVDTNTKTRGNQIFGRGQGKLTLLDGHWEHILGSAYSKNQRHGLTNDRITSFNRGDKTKYDYQTNVLFDTLAVADARHTVTVLAEQEKETFESSSLNPKRTVELDSNGFVGMYKVDFFRQLFLTGAVREDKNDLFQDARTYRATAAYQFLSTDTKLRSSWGTGVKNPTMFELYGFTPTFQGNPNLTPEETKGWDVGIDQVFWNKKAMVGVTYFNQVIKNQIGSNAAFNSSINSAGENTVRGIELEGAVEPIERLSLRASYSYMNTEGDSVGNDQLIRRPSQTGSFNAHYRFEDNRTSANLGVVYNGRAADTNFEITPSRRVALNGYTLVNLGAAYKATDSVELFGRVENLLDKDYTEVYGFQSVGRAGYVGVRTAF